MGVERSELGERGRERARGRDGGWIPGMIRTESCLSVTCFVALLYKCFFV